jgi:lysozyme
MTDPALPAAVEIITSFEGFRSAPYLDTGGIPTIGFGATYLADGSRVTMTSPPMTRTEAEALLSSMVVKVLARVRAMVHVTMSDNSAASLCSFAFNTGTGALANSTLLRLLNEGAPLTHVAGQFSAWVYDTRGHVDPGLIRRRAAEAALFVKPDTPAAEPDTDVADQLDDEFNQPE